MRIEILLIVTAVLAICGCCSIPGIPELGNQTQVPQQPQTHEQPGQPPVQPPCSFAGTWNTNWGEMVLSQNGSRVTGTYTFDDGKIAGSVSDYTLTGGWSENAIENAYLPPDNAGDVILHLSEDCNNLTGEWRYGSENEYVGGWSGERVR